MTALFDTENPCGQTAGTWLRAAQDRLAAAAVETPAFDARMLLLEGLEIPHSVFISNPHLPLMPEEVEKLEAMLLRREGREPVSRILGWREFYGRKFVINQHVLDPRADTETLIEATLDGAAQHFGPERQCFLLDVGTGSGCIAVTLLAERPNWRAVATDVSGDALALARENAERHGVAERLELIETNWVENLSDSFDIVVSNPPYIRTDDIAGLMPEVRDHDPVLALKAGDEGMDAYKQIMAGLDGVLNANGLFLVEAGAGQARDIQELARQAGLLTPASIQVNCRDLGGHDRVVLTTASKT